MSHSAHFHVENPSFENWLLRVVMVTVVWLPLNVCSSGVGSSGAAAACVSASPSPSAAIPVLWQYCPAGSAGLVTPAGPSGLEGGGGCPTRHGA